MYGTPTALLPGSGRSFRLKTQPNTLREGCCMNLLNESLKQDLLQRGFSRRSLGRIAAMVSAGAALPFYNEPAMAQLSAVRNMPPDAVKINANENPLGPCPEAL